MKQDPITEVLLPLNSKDINPINNYTWDYVYEPESYELIDGLVLRYVETITLRLCRKYSIRTIGQNGSYEGGYR